MGWTPNAGRFLVAAALVSAGGFAFAAPPPSTPPPAAPTPAPAWQVAHADIRGSLAGSVVATPASDSAPLGAMTARVVMWDLDVRRDLEAGDKLDVVYGHDAAGALVVAATRYQSARRAQTFEAYLFQAPEDAFASYWTPEGVEVPRRLKDGPLRSYDQITSLLKDRPTHKGMDFKTPVGTPVYAHRDGHVSRANWRHGPNGNCLEIAFDDGVRARYLHLSALKVGAGAAVKRGQVIALTGNTGRSTAPHLHYELERGGRIVDPLDVHGTARRTLPAAAKKKLAAVVTERRALMDAKTP